MWSTVQNISQSKKRCFPHDSWSCPWEKYSKPLYVFFPSPFNRKYVHTVACTVVFVGPAHFVFNAYPGRNATCPLSSCSNKNDGPRGRFNCISTVSCKGSVCVEVLTSFYGRFFVEEGQFIKYTPSTSSLHLGSHFFHLLTPPRFGALNLPEVNQFTGNCFRMVRIVLKITFLKLRYPKGATGRLPLCRIMALDIINDKTQWNKGKSIWKPKKESFSSFSSERDYCS